MPFTVQPELYDVWKSMRERCRNPRFKQFMDYGGRGIDICPEWDDYRTFERDMSPRPKGTLIDRIDNDLGYSKTNCRWVTHKESQRNRRNALWIEIEGVRHRVVELADQSGLKSDTIVARAKAGLSLQDVLSPKPRFGNSPEQVEAAWRKSAAARAARTHCANGHEWNAESILITKDGARACRICCRLKMARRRTAKAAAAGPAGP
jgi:hypothetical protein